MQHGEAAPEEVDPARPLTPRGREEVARVARMARKMGVRAERILHSGKLRALETAEILARELGSSAKVTQTDGLAPKDDPRQALQTIESSNENLILVGHLPHLSRLAGLLLVGDPNREIVAFRMGALVALARESGSGWRLRWIIPPEAGG
ncbi:MAG: phosphohistidine phosphatase SixA [Gemmatimonadales bacterium]|nr:MAG: phosphohistidine phosphatase SixA [Gemmatimonadales bacterium]